MMTHKRPHTAFPRGISGYSRHTSGVSQDSRNQDRSPSDSTLPSEELDLTVWGFSAPAECIANARNKLRRSTQTFRLYQETHMTLASLCRSWLTRRRPAWL